MKPVKLAMICENCFHAKHNAITVSCRSAEGHGNIDVPIIAKCPKCKEITSWFSLDNNIADAISYLNKIGYRTIFSCQGHAKCSLEEDGKTLIVDYDHPYFLIDLERSTLQLNTEFLRICKKLKFSEVYCNKYGLLIDEHFDFSTMTTEDALKSLKDVRMVSFMLHEETIDRCVSRTFWTHKKLQHTPEMVTYANRDLEILFSVKCQMLTDELKSSFGKKKAK